MNDLVALAAPRLLAGALVTLQIAALAGGLALLLALPLALARLSRRRPLSAAAQGYVLLLRGTPLLAQIYLVYYGLGQLDWVRSGPLWPVLREPAWCAVIAIALNSAAYTAEILRGAIRSVPPGQVEAAAALGLSRLQRLRRVVLPLALRQGLPAYGNELVQLIQATALASAIALMELTGAARSIAAQTFRPVEVFALAGAVYLAMTLGLTQVVRALERRLNPAGPPGARRSW